MKVQLLAAASLAATLAAAPAFAQDAAPANYVQFNIGSGVAGKAAVDVLIGGLNTASDDVGLDAGLFGSIAAGHDFGNGLSLEAEGVYAKNDGNGDDMAAVFGPGASASVQTLGGLVNAKYAFNTGWHGVAPYVGGGVGYGRTKIAFAGADDSNSGIMWQAKAGLTIPTNEHLTWDLGYRFIGAPQYDQNAAVFGTTGELKVNTYVHVLSLGARVSF